MPLLFAAACLVLLLMLPQQAAQAARDALSIWAHGVVPSLFPYMVLCRLLSARLARWGLGVCPACAVLGLLGGSPAGAAAIAGCAQQGQLSRARLLPLCALTGTVSPMFLLGTVSGWAKSAATGQLLLAAQSIGALATALVVGWVTRRDSACTASAAVQPAASESGVIAQSVQSILHVGGCIVLFSVAAEGAHILLPGLRGVSGALLHATLEISGGMHALTALSLPRTLRAASLCAAAGFGGVSLLAQNLHFLRPLGVKAGTLLAFALLRALLSAAAGVLLLPLWDAF